MPRAFSIFCRCMPAAVGKLSGRVLKHLSSFLLDRWATVLRDALSRAPRGGEFQFCVGATTKQACAALPPAALHQACVMRLI
jgi:hypothetical protein